MICSNWLNCIALLQTTAKQQWEDSGNILPKHNNLQNFTSISQLQQLIGISEMQLCHICSNPISNDTYFIMLQFAEQLKEILPCKLFLKVVVLVKQFRQNIRYLGNRSSLVTLTFWKNKYFVKIYRYHKIVFYSSLLQRTMKYRITIDMLCHPYFYIFQWKVIQPMFLDFRFR